MHVNMYKYYSAQKFIADVFAQKKRKNQRFSIRAWAKALGIKSHTPLISIIAGKRKTPISLHPLLVKNLLLSEEESHFLLHLIHFENSKDQFSRVMLLERIEFLQKHKNLKMKELANFEILSDPFYGQLIEMSDIKGATSDPDWIRKKSRMERSRSEVELAINTLLNEGFLKRETDGRLKKCHQHVTNVFDLANIGSQTYLRNTALLAAEQIGHQPILEREYNGYALNICKKNLSQMKEHIRAFIKDFIIQFEAKRGEGDSTYQLNIQLFNLLKNEDF